MNLKNEIKKKRLSPFHHVIRENEGGDILNKKRWTFKENIIGGQYKCSNPLNWKGEKILNLILDHYTTKYTKIRLK